MTMAKPEHNPWAYSPQWNYYPPHVLNFPKLPLPSGPKLNSYDARESHHEIRCPEPRRPYQVPCSNFGSYCHQDNLSAGPYIQSTPLYYPKQYIHRPVPHDNYNSSTYKFNENLHSYPACSNSYHTTKDESNSAYQMPWNSTSHYKKKPELDVRRFLATWQEKDDDLNDMSSESEEQKKFQAYESSSVPLDCTKRNNIDKNIKKRHDNFMSGHPPNTNGCVVQPYYVKNSTIPIESELNNNIPQRNNLNYGHNNMQSFHGKNYYSNSDYYKPGDKFLSCEHSFTYPQQLNNCNNNVNQVKNNVDCRRQKVSMPDNSERSQYNLTSSLESGDLFCDINSRNEDTFKQHIHSTFSEIHNKAMNDGEQAFISHNNEFSDNLVFTDLHSVKEPWDIYPPSTKYKEAAELVKPPINKLPLHSDFESHLINNDVSHNNSGSIAYEGAFNILPNLNDSKITGNNPVEYNSDGRNAPDVHSKPSVTNQCMSPDKTPGIGKCNEDNSRIKPYHYSEEISSDDIDISIASSGDLVVEEESIITPVSVINFSHARKDKNSNSQSESNPECTEVQNNAVYTESFFPDKTDKVSLSKKKVCMDINLGNEINENSTGNVISPENCLEVSDSTFKASVMDLTVFKPPALDKNHNPAEKQSEDYLGVPNDYFNKNESIEQLKIENPCNDVDRKLTFQDDTIDVNSLSPYIDDHCNSSHDSPPKMNHEPSSLSCTNENHIQSDSCNAITICSEQKGNKLEESKLALLEGDCNTADTTVLDSEVKTQENDLLLSKPSNEISSSFGGCSFDEYSSNTITNENLLLLAHCSQEYGCHANNEVKDTQECVKEAPKSTDDSNKNINLTRDSVIKCSLRWDKIFNVTPEKDNKQPDMSLDLGPAKVELRMPSESCSSGQWKIVEADNKVQSSSIVQVKRLILKRKSQSEERIPKMVIKKTEGQVYRSYLKKEPNETVLNCGKFKICYDVSSKSRHHKSTEDTDS